MVNAPVVLVHLLGATLSGTYLLRFIRKDEDFFMDGRSLNPWTIGSVWSGLAMGVVALTLVIPLYLL